MSKFNLKQFITENKIGPYAKLDEAGPGFTHDCAAHVVHETYGHGICLEGQHTLVENAEGNHVVTHYDVFFKEGSKTVEDIPVEELKIITESSHNHPKNKKKNERLDPVGKEDGDIDNDGDEDETDKYLAKRRKAIGKAMKKDKKEGNAFGKALKDARENGDKTFVVSGKTYKVEDYKQHENYDVGTQENTKAKLDATPGQSSDDWQQQVETMQKKNASMREALAKVWGVDEGHNPFAEKITRGTGKKGLAKSLDKLYGPKKGSKKEDKTMTGKSMTKVEVDPDMKEKKTDK